MNGFESDIERADEAELARQALSLGGGVRLSGEPGSGRSRLVRSIVSGLPEQVRRRVWIHDDDRRLDEIAQRRLLDAAAGGDVLPLVVTAVRRAPEAWLYRLMHDRELTTIPVKPFDRPAMLKLARRFLDGALDPRAVPSLLPRRVGGDLVVLHEALRELQEKDALVLADGVWVLSGPVPPLESLRHLIFPRIGVEKPSDPTETLLDVIGLAPELGLTRTRRLIQDLLAVDPDADLERLEAAGAIDVLENDGTTECRIHDPVVETFLPHTLGRLRRRRLANSIVGALSNDPLAEASERELLALARLAIPFGWPVDGATLTRAAGAALRASRVDLAARLAAAALASGADVDASFVLAAAESQSGRSSAAVTRLEGIEVDERSDPDRFRTRRELIELVSARVDDPKTLWSLPSRSSTDRAAGDDEVSSRDDLAALAIPADDRRRPSGGVLRSGLVVDHAAVLRGEKVAFEASLEVMQGRSDHAIAMLRDVEAELEEAGADTFRIRWGKAYSRLWDHSFTTTYDELSLLADEAAGLGQAEQEALCRWSAAWTLCYAGLAMRAADEFRGVLDDLDRLELADTAALARIALAKSLAGTVQADVAQEILTPFLSDPAVNPMIGAWAHEAHGWLLRGAGRSAEAVEAFATAAAMQAAMGFSLSRLIALSGAARSGGAARVVEEIEELAGSVDGDAVAILVRQARALARSQSGGSPEQATEFDLLGHDAVALGMHGVAAEAFSVASRLHRQSEGGAGLRAAVASERRAAEQVSLCGTPLFASSGESAGELSQREREIAALAVAGLSNREIADEFVISVRTVETHLLRIFRKLGVRRRSELATALTPLGPEEPIRGMGEGR